MVAFPVGIVQEKVPLAEWNTSVLFAECTADIEVLAALEFSVGVALLCMLQGGTLMLGEAAGALELAFVAPVLILRGAAAEPAFALADGDIIILEAVEVKLNWLDMGGAGAEALLG